MCVTEGAPSRHSPKTSPVASLIPDSPSPRLRPLGVPSPDPPPDSLDPEQEVPSVVNIGVALACKRAVWMKWGVTS